MKKVLALILASAMVISMAACGSPASSAAPTGTSAPPAFDSKAPSASVSDDFYNVDRWTAMKPEDVIEWIPKNAPSKTVALLLPDSTSEFYNNVATSAKAVFEGAGYKMLWDGVNGDSTRGVNDIESWVASGVDAIVVMAQDNTCDNALKEAMNAGVLIVSASAEVKYYHHWLLQNNYDVGYQVAVTAADWIKEKFGDTPIEYITISNTNSQATVDKSNGVKEGMVKLLPNCINVGDIVFTSAVGTDGVQNQLETLMSQHPDVKAVVCMHNLFSSLALQTAKSMNKAVKDQFAVFGASLSDNALAELQNKDGCYEGEVYMGDQGRTFAEHTLALLEGKKLTRWHYALNYSITQDNVGTYYDDYYAELAKLNK